MPIPLFLLIPRFAARLTLITLNDLISATRAPYFALGRVIVSIRTARQTRHLIASAAATDDTQIGL